MHLPFSPLDRNGKALARLSDALSKRYGNAHGLGLCDEFLVLFAAFDCAQEAHRVSKGYLSFAGRLSRFSVSPIVSLNCSFGSFVRWFVCPLAILRSFSPFFVLQIRLCRIDQSQNESEVLFEAFGRCSSNFNRLNDILPRIFTGIWFLCHFCWSGFISRTSLKCNGLTLMGLSFCWCVTRVWCFALKFPGLRSRTEESFEMKVENYGKSFWGENFRSSLAIASTDFSSFKISLIHDHLDSLLFCLNLCEISRRKSISLRIDSETES